MILTEDEEENEMFATCQSTSAKSTANGIGRQKRKMSKKLKSKSKKKRCLFIDDEAGVSGDDSEEDDEDDFFTQMPGTQAEDEGDPDVDMQAKYLQSIR